ncbi:RCC1 domain-containing protein [Paenibacillus sp. Leaf72]|uniref:RCC1 domain-containing protein n=1 Tax=Paenibacillus sp. Leaf72 TaxID=1736234 RepID=UPI0007014390|nr:hypothetical protein [Paenibacillus sp. Leaf72]KQN96812.1 hypothetical protein ASF12_22325 [Paenibacillus sp. Leaf72]
MRKFLKKWTAIVTIAAIIVSVSNFSPISAFASSNVTPMIDAGADHSIALKSDGTVLSWGSNEYGQIGVPSSGELDRKLSPEYVPNLSDVTYVTAGAGFSVALKSDRTVWAWGKNADHQLGAASFNNKESNPVKVTGISDVISISTGTGHVIALKSDGTVWTWGSNSRGQLGNGESGFDKSKSTPSQVSGLTNIIAVSGGAEHSLALKSDGTVWSWGYNSASQLGDGTYTNRTTPIQIGLTNVKSISAGQSHSLALKKDGTVWAWGWNANGQLGDGTYVNRNLPVQVSLPVINSISTDVMHSSALDTTGRVWTWGSNTYGQLGDGSTTDSNIPKSIGITNVSQVSSGYLFTLAMKTDGTIAGWGYNVGGQLGSGDRTNKYTPTLITGVTLEEVIPDTEPPTILLTPYTTTLTNQDVKVNVDVTDNVGVQIIKWSNGIVPESFFAANGTDITAARSFVATKNNVFTVWAKDTAGNQSLKTISITNIDKTPPAAPTFTVDRGDPMDGLATVTITYPSDAFIKEYGIRDVWSVYNGPITLSQDSNVKARSTDAAGNVSEVVEVTVRGLSSELHLARAYAAVVKAEESLLQSDVSDARALLYYIAIEYQEAYGLRLDAVQALIDEESAYQLLLDEAISAVAMAEMTIAQNDVETARHLVNSLKPAAKESLNERLDIVQAMIDAYAYQLRLTEATGAVVKVEGSLRQVDLDTARTLVNELNNSDKAALNDRLVRVQESINYGLKVSIATEAVAKAEGTQKQDDVDAARILVDTLNTAEKSSLNTRLDAVQTAIDALNDYVLKLAAATEAVEKAESTKTQDDVNAARPLVNALNAVDKAALGARLDTIQEEIDADAYQAKLTLAVEAVEKAELTRTQDDVDAARLLVNALEDTEKGPLNTRLDAIQAEIDDQDNALVVATEAVEIAEASLLQADVTSAEALVNALPETMEKRNLVKRIVAVKKEMVTANNNVLGFEVTATTKNSIQLGWNKVEGANYYKLERLVNGVVMKTFTLTGTTIKYKDTNLSLNTVYEYRITPKKGTLYLEPTSLESTTFEVVMPEIPTLISASVNEQGILKAVGKGNAAYKLYLVVKSDKGALVSRTSITSLQEKTYGFAKGGNFTVQIEAYDSTNKVSSYSTTEPVQVSEIMLAAPTPMDFRVTVTREGTNVVFRASVLNDLVNEIESYQFEIYDSSNKRLAIGWGSAKENRLEFTNRRGSSITPAGEYTVLVKGKRGISLFSEPVVIKVAVE